MQNLHKLLMVPAFFLMTALGLFAQSNVGIIPAPVSQTSQPGEFIITDNTSIRLEGDSTDLSADFLNRYLKKYYGFQLPVSSGNGEKSIVLKVNKTRTTEGAYSLDVTSAGIQIEGTPNGIFNGIQTLIQLLPPKAATALEIGNVKIKDAPRFAYRGMMLDCSRHFFSVEQVKNFIDMLAIRKINRFHWHLTDDQGWRIEIKKYPKLTEVGGWRKATLSGHYTDKPVRYDHTRYGGFYTQDELKDVVKFAQERFITIIPEVEMPGHSMAAITAYPELACNPAATYRVTPYWGVVDTILCPTEYTFNFYRDVLKEVLDIFPSHYIHIGGDEAPKKTWETSEFCQNLIQEKGLKDEHGLQSYFVQTMEKFLNENGRDIIGWDEILEGGLAPNATVMSWQGEKGGIAAAQQKHGVIMAPNTYVYLDYAQTKNEDSLVIGNFLPLEKVYNYEPYPETLTKEDAKYIYGVQANLWTEYISSQAKAEYMLFPRFDAVAEIAWSPKEAKDFAAFKERLKAQYERYKFWGVSYYDLNTDSGVPGSEN